MARLDHTLVGIMLHLMVLGDFAMAAPCIFSGYIASNNLEHTLSPDKSLARREAVHRYCLTACLKIWAAVNVQSIRLWDGIIACLFAEVVRYVFDCGLLKAERWKDDVWRVLLSNALPLVVMVPYRGELWVAPVTWVGSVAESP